MKKIVKWLDMNEEMKKKVEDNGMLGICPTCGGNAYHRVEECYECFVNGMSDEVRDRWMKREGLKYMDRDVWKG